jgi:hypothetical protein
MLIGEAAIVRRVGDVSPPRLQSFFNCLGGKSGYVLALILDGINQFFPNFKSLHI